MTPEARRLCDNFIAKYQSNWQQRHQTTHAPPQDPYDDIALDSQLQPSAITDADIDEFENQIQHRLPSIWRYLLGTVGCTVWELPLQISLNLPARRSPLLQTICQHSTRNILTIGQVNDRGVSLVILAASPEDDPPVFAIRDSLPRRMVFASIAGMLGVLTTGMGAATLSELRDSDPVFGTAAWQFWSKLNVQP